SGFISGGQAEGIFQEMLDHQHCDTMSKNHNFGIAANIYNQLSKNLPQ
ncbi:rod-binding protein, partial [bacterium]|nr:rod-binding protein [bacterium]